MKRIWKYKSIFELEALINKLKTTTKIALKNVIRSGKIISSLLYSFFIAFSIIILIIAPIALRSTYNHYVNLRYENQIYVIGTEEMIDFYNSNLGGTKYYNESYVNGINNIEFFANNSLGQVFVDEINDLEIGENKLGIAKLNVKEIRVLDIENGDYKYVGENRSFYATIIGYEKNIIKERSLLRGTIPEGKNVLIGDSLSEVLFEKSLVQKIRLRENTSSLQISGIVVDPFASGFTVYIEKDVLEKESILTGTNIITIGEIEKEKEEDLKRIVEKYGYKIERVNEVLEEDPNNYRTFSYSYNLLSFILAIYVTIQLTVFSVLYFTTYMKDHILLYKLGISKRKISDIVIKSVVFQLLGGTLLGGFFGSIVAKYFLVFNTYLKYFAVYVGFVLIWEIVMMSIASVGVIRKSIVAIK
ncbi:MAG: hypothetical protein ACTSSG_08255 [Candidatus Heimdallarchaeaceae archaeon]